VYSYLTPTTYDDALKNNFGGRLSAHVLGTDLAAYVFDGAATVPAVQLSLSADIVAFDASGAFSKIRPRPEIGLTPTYHRVTVAGASAVVPLGEIILRGEIAVTKDYRRGSPLITEKNFESVLEAEHTFPLFKGTLTAIGLASYADPQVNAGTVTNTPSLT